MEKKNSSKGHPPVSPSGKQGTGQAGRLSPIIWVGGLVVVVAVAVVALRPRAEPAATAVASATPATADRSESPVPTADQGAALPQPDAATLAKTEATARMGPHKQATLPPVPFQGYAPPRPPEVVTAAYQFAAEHPEILSYVPCFCGCEQAGHSGNHDCFVKSRAANGDVTEWDPHGVECTVCIDVANRSRQMFASGASVRDIRAAIEKEFGPLSPRRTPTPAPPAARASRE